MCNFLLNYRWFDKNGISFALFQHANENIFLIDEQISRDSLTNLALYTVQKADKKVNIEHTAPEKGNGCQVRL